MTTRQQHRSGETTGTAHGRSVDGESTATFAVCDTDAAVADVSLVFLSTGQTIKLFDYLLCSIACAIFEVFNTRPLVAIHVVLFMELYVFRMELLHRTGATNFN